MSGGSYIINSEGITENRQLIIYPEVSILIETDPLGSGNSYVLGSGGSGEVKLGTIIKCTKNDKLIGKQVAIKSFFSDKKFTPTDKKIYEKFKMTSFQLDEEETLIEHQYIASLYFDITTGPLKDSLIYEYGGNTLCSYISSPFHNLENNIRIMKQLFNILYQLANRDNMHNDIKCDNIVYSVDSNNNVNIKMIDFGSSVSISALDAGTVTLGDRTNMNTPETIYNHLKNNKYGGQDLIKHIVDQSYNIFNRWYYYPFISIMCFLFTGVEYSTGNHAYIHELIGWQPPKERMKYRAFEILLNNEHIKRYLEQNIYPIFAHYLPELNTLIDEMCKPIPSTRRSEDNIIELLSK
jgi:serine/threonine protein kinase